MALASEAGPSSFPVKAIRGGGLATFRQLNDALEAANPTVSVTEVQKRLQDVLPILKSSCTSDKSTFLKGDGKVDLEQSLKNVAEQCAKLHQVDQEEMNIALRLYLDSEDVQLDQLAIGASTSSRSGLRSSFISQPNRSVRGRQSVGPASGDVNTQLVEALSVFFFEERLYALRCVSALLRIGDDRFHDLHEIAEEILDVLVDQRFALQCLARVEVLSNKHLSDSIREIPRYSTYWSKHIVKEQIALLECVFLAYYSRLESSAPFVDSVHSIIQSTNFGLNNSSSGFFDVEAGVLLDNVSFLFVLLAIESLDVEKLLDDDNLITSIRPSAIEETTYPQLIQAPEIVGKVVDFLRTSTIRDHLRAPLMIGWALYISRIDGALSDWAEARGTEKLPKHLQGLKSVLDQRGGSGQIWTELMSVAMSPEFQGFDTLNKLAESPLLRWHIRSAVTIAVAPPSSLAMRAVMKGFVLSITELIRPEYITNYSGFIDLWQNTFANDDDIDRQVMGQASDGAAALCAQFWEVDYDYGNRRALLDTATRRFPVSFRPLVQLCKALTGSGPNALHTSDEAYKASMAVFGYLAEVGTITHVLNVPSSLTAPYEIVNDPNDPSNIVHRATRSISVFGKHLQIPIGSLGKIISAQDQSPVIITWDVSATAYSVWRLACDVLANFAGLLDTKDSITMSTIHRSGDGGVFEEQTQPASFASLSPDDNQAYNVDVAAEIMNLFSSILATQSRVSTALIEHLEGNDLADVNAVQPTAINSGKPALISIVTGILNQALSSPSSASRVIISSYRLLTLLLSATPSQHIWPSFRSSGLLVGTQGVRSLLSRNGHSTAMDTSALLVYETSIGKYAGLLAMLNLQHALLSDTLQMMHCISSTESEIRVDVVMRALRFITEQVWLEYQSWKYVHIRQRIEIGRKCIQIFQRILNDGSLRSNMTAYGRIYQWAHTAFVSPQSISSMTHPMMNIITSSAPFIHGLQRSSRQVEVEVARDHIEACIHFARSIVEARRQDNVSSPIDGSKDLPSSLGFLERAFIGESILPSFDSITSSRKRRNQDSSFERTNDTNLANALFRQVFISHSLGGRIEAVKLITSICGSLSDTQASTKPIVVSQIGSLVDIAEITSNLVDLIENAEEDDELRACVLNMLSAFVKSQPGIGALLLSGKYVVDEHLESEKINTPEKEKHKEERSAVKIASKFVEDSALHLPDIQNNLGQLRILEASIKFLVAAWCSAPNQLAAFDSVRVSRKFWDAIIRIAIEQNVSFSHLEPSALDLAEGSCRTDCDESVKHAALVKTCSAYALQLLAADIQIVPLQEKASKAAKISSSLESLLDVFKYEKKFENIFKAMLKIQYDPHRHSDVVHRFESTYPEISLDLFRLPARLDEYDERRQCGCHYLFDLDTLRFKLEGLLRSEAISNNVNESMIDTEANLQAILLVAGVNLNWSAIDSQSMLLRSWTRLLSVAIGPLFSEFEANKEKGAKMRLTITKVWVECGKIVGSEEAGNEVAEDLHALRVALLAVLLDIAWGRSPTNENQNDEKMHDNQISLTLNVMDEVVGLATHSILSIADIMRKSLVVKEPSMHRDMARIVLLCMQRYRLVFRQSISSKTSSLGRSELMRSLQRKAEVLTSHTISCTRIAIDRCLSNLDKQRFDVGGTDLENAMEILDYDLQLLTSALAIQLHQDSDLSVHSWSPKLQSAALFPAAFELFSRSSFPVHLLMHSTDLSDKDKISDEFVDVLGSGLEPPFWNTLLGFFLDMACQQSTAEPLILAGVMNAFDVNAISLALDNAKSAGMLNLARISPRVSNGTMDNAIYHQWVKMLRVVVALINALDVTPQHAFVRQEILSFFSIFHTAIEHSLQRALFEANNTMGMRSTFTGSRQLDSTRNAITMADIVTTNQLHELGLIVNIYVHVLCHVQDLTSHQSSIKGRRTHNGIIDSFIRNSTLRLQECVHLLQHPHELLALLGLDETKEKKDSTNISSMASRFLSQTSSDIVSSFWSLTQSFDVLCSTETSMWNLENVMIVPTIGTSPSRPSSIGTLLDLTSYLSDALQKVGKPKQSSEMNDSDALVAAIEQTISLASTQLGLAMHGRTSETQSTPVTTTPTSVATPHQQQQQITFSLSKSANIHTLEVEAGLGRDVCQSTDSAKAVLKDRGANIAYMDIISAFQKRWLISTE